jgi:hypothetical protein
LIVEQWINDRLVATIQRLRAASGGALRIEPAKQRDFPPRSAARDWVRSGSAALLVRCASRSAAAVEKFIGDAVVGTFGLTEAQDDDALRALRAALLRVLNQHWPSATARAAASLRLVGGVRRSRP